jgi:uncharacterized protein YndB with AHSA1/START domain
LRCGVFSPRHPRLVFAAFTDRNELAKWWATFDCSEGARDRWVEQFERAGFATSLGSLRVYLTM